MTQQPSAPIILGVVGHTNTGKTSLIRTLLRDSQFGAVADRAGTTRHVERAYISLDHHKCIELRDTPGLEDSVALAQYLQKLQAQGLQSRQCLEAFIGQSANLPEFEQETKVLKQALQCDALLYVIDCREPVFEKYQQEIQTLRLAARPILPVLNFIHGDNGSVNQWKKTLAELGLHAQVAFDTVAYDFAAEHRLYQKLQTLLEAHYDAIQALVEYRQAQWLQLQHLCCQRIAHLLVDVTRLTVEVTQTSKEQASQTLQQQTRLLEQQCLTDLLQLMHFSQEEIALSQLPVSDGEWQLDLFSTKTLRILGMDTFSAAATGAAIGVGVDLLFAGVSLGAASATGAALGAAWHNTKRFSKNVFSKFSGHKLAQVDTTTLDILLLRQQWLLQTLFQRGHAAQNAAQLKTKPDVSLPAEWPAMRSDLRNAVNIPNHDPSAVQQQLTSWLQTQFFSEA